MKPYYDDGTCTIYHADCRDVLPTLADGSVDLFFTDPPYGHNNNNNDLAHRREAALGLVEKVPDEWARPIANDGPEANELVRFFFGESARLLVPGGCCCCCCGGGGPDPQFARWSLWLDEALGFKQMIVWDKGGLGMGWHYRRSYETVLVGEKPGAPCKWYGGSTISNVVRVPGIRPTAEMHPTPKPVGLASRFIAWHSLPGDLVVDPFLGGGSTAVAAKAAERRFLGIEVDEGFCEMAANRLAQEVLAFEVVP